MLIIAVDPGLVCGYGVWSSEVLPLRVLSDEIPYINIGRHVRNQLEMSKAIPEVHIVVERYTMSNSGIKTSQPEALKGMGQMELLADLYGCRLHYYLPATTKKMIPNAKLRQVGWYKPTRDGHANDAARLVGAHLATAAPETFGSLFGL